MSLTRKQEMVIDIIRDQEMYGLDIVNKSGGALRNGVVYLTLSAMEAEGLLESRKIPSEWDSGLPRRMYRVTKQGMQLFLHRHCPIPEARLVSG